MPDSILTSLLRGRALAATASAVVLGSSTATLITGTLNEWTVILNTVLAFVSVIAAIASKMREIWRGQS